MNFIKLLFTTKNKRLYLFTTVFQAHSYIYVKFFSFNAIIKMLNKIKVSSNQPHYSIDDIELAEKRISKKLKITQCLIRSMTIFRILKMNGYAPTIKIGIHGNSNIESFKSHSWIEINGRAINNDKEVDFKKIMEIS